MIIHTESDSFYRFQAPPIEFKYYSRWMNDLFFGRYDIKNPRHIMIHTEMTIDNYNEKYKEHFSEEDIRPTGYNPESLFIFLDSIDFS
jgi:hypothetical protein